MFFCWQILCIHNFYDREQVFEAYMNQTRTEYWLEPKVQCSCVPQAERDTTRKYLTKSVKHLENTRTREPVT